MRHPKTTNSSDIEYTIFQAACLLCNFSVEKLDNLTKGDVDLVQKYYAELKEYAASETYRGLTNYHEIMEKLCDLNLDREEFKDIKEIYKDLPEFGFDEDQIKEMIKEHRSDFYKGVEFIFQDLPDFWKIIKISKTELDIFALSRYMTIEYPTIEQFEKHNKRQPFFLHSHDYLSITLNNCKTFTLTSNQAVVVEMLHKAYKKGTPDVSDTLILDRIGTTNIRLRDTFRSSPEIWKALIISRKKGSHRLNLPDFLPQK